VAIVAGLDPGLAGTSVVPSGWSPAGLVRHLAGAEYFWAECVLAGPIAPGSDDAGEEPPGESHHEPLSLSAALDRYRRQALVTDEIVAGLTVDARPAGLDQPGLPTEVRDVREVLLHLIEETARHAGHLDIARELLDGRTGLGPR
jgi:hypothetical protein